MLMICDVKALDVVAVFSDRRFDELNVTNIEVMASDLLTNRGDR